MQNKVADSASAPKSPPVAWAGVVLTSIGCAFLIANGIRQGGSWSDWLYMVAVCVAIVLVIAAVFSVVMRIQLASVARTFPGATLALVLPTSQLSWELISVSRSQSVAGAKSVPNTYCTLVIDRNAVRFVLGSVRPNALFTYPMSGVTDVGVGRVFQGLWMHPCLELTFGSNEEPLRVRLLLVRWVTIIPLYVRTPALEALVADIRTNFMSDAPSAS